MSAERNRRIVSLAALAIGAVLFAGTLYYVDIAMVLATWRRLGVAIPLALLASGAWHLTRTWAWSWCFERPGSVSFARLMRVRLAAEAFSYLTISGVAGEPLKVVLLGDRVDSREATASVALERIAYMIGTALIVGAGSIVAMATLPLSPIWMKVFRGFAIGAAVLAAGIILIVVRRDSYLLAALRAADRRTGSRIASGKIARFAAGVGRQLADLISGNATRVAVLTIASLIAYACMSLEAYLILRAVGVPITPAGALAVETFSRVASFASAFIPASIGALEASSIAAAAAVGATAAGAPLALARRLRGLFWAGIGLAIYPRGASLRRADDGRGTTKEEGTTVDGGRVTESGLHSTATRGETPEGGGRELESEHGQSNAGPILLYVASIADLDAPIFERIAGLPIAERVLRSASRASYPRTIVFADDASAPRLRTMARGIGGTITVVTSAADWQSALTTQPANAEMVAIGPGTVVSAALLEDAASIASAPGRARDVSAGPDWPVSGLLRLRAQDAHDVTALARELRARLVQRLPLPSGEDVSHQRGRLVLRVLEAADLRAAEQTIRRSSYKDTDNTLARWNRNVSLPISIALIRTPVTANQLSVALVALGFYSAWLFSLGHYWPGLLGGFLSLAASVLDGCDGEIARLKYQESALGCWIETFGDYSYYIAIFIGLTMGAVRLTGWPMFYWLGAIALGGTLASFALLIYLRSRITAGRPEKLHTIARARFRAEPSWWSRIAWRLSFVATRSAMPYGIFALSLVGLLPVVVVLAAIGGNVYWISLVLKLRHLLSETPETVAA